MHYQPDNSLAFIITAENLGKTVQTSEGSSAILSSVALKIKPAKTGAGMGASGSAKPTFRPPDFSTINQQVTDFSRKLE